MKRKVDPAVLAECRRQPCIVCNTSQVDACHIKTRGSGGHDHPENLLPMCRDHHMEQHREGWFTFCALHPAAAVAVTRRGWVLENQFGVWRLIRARAFS